MRLEAELTADSGDDKNLVPNPHRWKFSFNTSLPTFPKPQMWDRRVGKCLLLVFGQAGNEGVSSFSVIFAAFDEAIVALSEGDYNMRAS